MLISWNQDQDISTIKTHYIQENHGVLVFRK